MSNYLVKKNKESNKESEIKRMDIIDFEPLQILLNCLRNLWIILLVAIIGLFGGYFYDKYCVTPLYSSEVLLYVNSTILRDNLTTQDEDSQIVSQDKISLSKTLVQSYVIILNNRTTLTRIAEDTGIKWLTYDQISNMITAGAVNESEVLSVKVTSSDPKLSAKIANSVVNVLPDRVDELIDGSSVRVVDSAIPNDTPINKSKYKYPLLGFAGGFAFVCGIIALITVLDTKINDPEYVLSNINLPLLAQIPLIRKANSKRKKGKNADFEPENEEQVETNTFVLGYYSYSVKDNTIVENWR